MTSLYKYFINLGNLFFPKICAACGKNLIAAEKVLCTECYYNLPKTNFHHSQDNPVNKLFNGIVNINYGTSFFYFFKGSKYQTVIHRFKYKAQKEIGFELGRLFGIELKNSVFNEIDYIIPVPLHSAKLRKRGFNQSNVIASGISETLNKTVKDKSLFRIKNTDTQTKKTVEERRENVKSVFKVKYPKQLENKHILLIDDVITTGSTLASCAEEILKIKNTKVSVATLAVAAKT